MFANNVFALCDGVSQDSLLSASRQWHRGSNAKNVTEYIL